MMLIWMVSAMKMTRVPISQPVTIAIPLMGYVYIGIHVVNAWKARPM